jgi:N6-L-threonylcarbamoyladenine synthase
LAKLKNKPLYAVDHVVAHVYANFIRNSGVGVSKMPVSSKRSKPGDIPILSSRREESGDPVARLAPLADNGGDIFETPTPEFPLLSLVVSGGHTQLMIFHSHTDYEIVGQTRDDAVGEAFDKVAKVLGLPYPGGPSIAVAAENGDPHRYKLPKPVLKPNNGSPSLDFSFSGLKTALLRAVQAEVGKDYTFPSGELSGLLVGSQRADFAASFQQTAVDILIDKLKLAYDRYQPQSICLAGGVSASTLLRQQAQATFPNILLPPPGFSTDNAAMIASRGYFQSLSQSPIDPNQIDVKPTS